MVESSYLDQINVLLAELSCLTNFPHKQSNQKLLRDLLASFKAYGSLTAKQAGLVGIVRTRIESFKSHSNQPQTPERKVCRYCLDVGVIHVLVEGTETLALCVCDQGRAQGWKLPFANQIEKDLSSLIWEPVDWRDFRPTPDHPYEEKVKWWREKVRIAEDFWLASARGGSETTGKIHRELDPGISSDEKYLRL